MWVARDKDGTLNLWFNKPKRAINFWHGQQKQDGWKATEEFIQNKHEIDGKKFPKLTWEDEPIEIELVPKMLNAVREKLAESVDDYFDYVGHIQDIHPYSKEQEQNYYNDMCWRWQDWNDIKYDHPSTWDLNFDDYVDSKG